MIITAIVNQKGGVGKTTTAIQLAAALANRGMSVLAVDMDPQANLTGTLVPAGAAGEGALTVYEVLADGADPTAAVVPSAHPHAGVLDVLPASLFHKSLSVLDAAIGNNPDRYHRLSGALRRFEGVYDHVVIDTPPARDTLAYNALTAADGVVIPCEPSLYSADGIAPLKDSIDQTKAYTNPRVEIVGLLMTNYEHGTIVSKRMRSAVRDMAECLGTRVFDTPISHTTAVRKSQAAHTDIFTFDAKCSAARDYDAFCGQFLECVGGDGDGR